MTDHTRTKKIDGDFIWFLWSSKSSGKPLWQRDSNSCVGDSNPRFNLLTCSSWGIRIAVWVIRIRASISSLVLHEGFESLYGWFESMTFSFTSYSLGIRITWLVIRISPSKYPLLEFGFESVEEGFESLCGWFESVLQSPHLFFIRDSNCCMGDSNLWLLVSFHLHQGFESLD